MAKPVARAVSVLPFQAITIDWPISLGGDGRSNQNRPATLKQGFL